MPSVVSNHCIEKRVRIVSPDQPLLALISRVIVVGRALGSRPPSSHQFKSRCELLR